MEPHSTYSLLSDCRRAYTKIKIGGGYMFHAFTLLSPGTGGGEPLLCDTTSRMRTLIQIERAWGRKSCMRRLIQIERTRDITERPPRPQWVAAFMSAHSKIPYITPSMDVYSGKGSYGGAGRSSWNLRWREHAELQVCATAWSGTHGSVRAWLQRMSPT